MNISPCVLYSLTMLGSSGSLDTLSQAFSRNLLKIRSWEMAQWIKRMLSVWAWRAEYGSPVSAENPCTVVHTCNLNPGRWRQENLGDLLSHQGEAGSLGLRMTPHLWQRGTIVLLSTWICYCCVILVPQILEYKERLLSSIAPLEGCLLSLTTGLWAPTVCVRSYLRF